jgi:hypothetical protein
MRKTWIIGICLTLMAATLPAQDADSVIPERETESIEKIESDAALYTIGAVSASNLYFSYLVLGTVADSYASERYTGDTAAALAEETAALNTVSRDALERLLETQSLREDDKETVRLMVEVYDLLIGQAYGLIAFINGEDNGDQFQEYRRHAWERIAALLDIDEE